MISTNLSETGPPRIPPTFYKGPPSPDDKTDRVAAMNKITNFSIAAIMNSRGRKSEDDPEDFEAKRRKLAEAVPALGKIKNSVKIIVKYFIINQPNYFFIKVFHNC